MFLMPETSFSRWKPAALLRVTGDDALNFLQGQFTNDLRKSVAGVAIYGLWLNQKGKVVADSFVAPADGATAQWVVSYFSPAAAIRERLEAFIIADDVAIEDRTAEWAAVTIFGEVDRGALTAAVEESFVFTGRRERGAQAQTEWIFPETAAAKVAELLAGGRELTAAEVALRRVQAGIPAVPADIGLGELPNEGGLEAEAISYTKGCYLGQEVMARLKSMGQVRRRLRCVRGTGSVPASGTLLYQGERKVGELRSAVAAGDGFAGLALLMLMNLDATAGLSLAPGGAATITVGELA